MTYGVMNSARLTRIMLAGVVCNPIPARSKDSTITNRVKHVTIMSSPGATDSIVIEHDELHHAPGDGLLAGQQQALEIEALRRSRRRRLRKCRLRNEEKRQQQDQQ